MGRGATKAARQNRQSLRWREEARERESLWQSVKGESSLERENEREETSEATEEKNHRKLTLALVR